MNKTVRRYEIKCPTEERSTFVVIIQDGDGDWTTWETDQSGAIEALTLIHARLA